MSRNLPAHQKSVLKEPKQSSAIHLWPAFGIVALMLFFLLAPGQIAPSTAFHFVSGQASPFVAALLLSTWWMLSDSATKRMRWLTLISMTVLTGIAFWLSHETMQMPVRVYVLPAALSALVAVMALSRSLGGAVQRVSGFATYVVVMLLSLAFRTGEMDAAFEFRLIPRWRPTAERQFLDSLASRPSSDSAPVSPLNWEEYVEFWPAFRGPRRDGVVMGTNIRLDWNERPPSESWRRLVGPGWSSLCVVGPRLFTQEQRADLEVVTAYQVENGNPIWTHEFSGRFESPMGGVGPRATPTFDKGRLFVTGAKGVLMCLDANDGSVFWKTDLKDLLDLSMPEWGFTSSPLVHDDLVVIFVGGGEGKGTVAVHCEDGQVAWVSGDGDRGYSSPQLANLRGIEQILVSSNRGIHAFDPISGAVIWNHDWDIGGYARVTQPLVVENAVYLGTGYGNGTRRLDVELVDGNWIIQEAWTAGMKPYFNDAVHHEGYLYGFDGPIFMCLDADSGDRVWKRGRYGHGQVVLLKDQSVLVITTERGDVVLVRATPDQHQELARFTAVDGVTWNHPVVAQDRLLIRNANEMVCYEVGEEL